MEGNTRDQAIDVPALAGELLATDGMFDRRDERVTFELYRLLGGGKPVSAEGLAARTGRSASDIADWLRAADVHLDERGDVVAFHGVSLRPTENAVEVNGQTLYAWCAADALYIPALLGHPARVSSTDPISGQTMSLAIDGGGRLREAEPSTAVLSMIRPDDMSSIPEPDDDASGDDALPAVCGPITFFASEQTGNTFTNTKRFAATFLLTIEEGLELVRLTNSAVFGSALGGCCGG